MSVDVGMDESNFYDDSDISWLTQSDQRPNFLLGDSVLSLSQDEGMVSLEDNSNKMDISDDDIVESL